MNTQDKILDRLNKLLSLANNAGATENEAMVALSMAHKLMAKHNLSLLDVERRADAGGMQSPELRVGELRWNLGTSRVWARSVLQAVCLVHYCKIIQLRAGEFAIIGTRENTVVAQRVAAYCMQALKNASKPYGHGSNSFLMGAAIRLHWKAKQIINYNNADQTTGKSLIVLSNALTVRNDKFIKQKYGRLINGKSKEISIHNAVAFGAGKQFSDKLDLQRSIG